MSEPRVSPEKLKKLKPGLTAAEVQEILEADPGWMAARDREDQDRQRKDAEWRQAEAPLVEDLRRAGFEVNSAWDLVNTDAPYPKALPILLEHLERPYPDRVLEGIARALAVPDAKFGWDVLTRLYREQDRETDAKDGLAVAIAGASDDEVLDDVIALVRDPRHGKSRLLLLSALERSRDQRVRAVLEELEADPEVTVEARRILKGAT